MNYLELVEKFNSCELDLKYWRHSSHIIVAFYYAINFKEKSFECLKNSINKYNESKNLESTVTKGYHETLTFFWVNMIDNFIKKNAITEFNDQNIELLLESELNDKFLPYQYYTKELLFSFEAKQNALESDLKSTNTGELNGKEIYLRRLDCQEWLNTRDYRYSDEAFKHDPNMPHQSEEEEKVFYAKYLKTDYMLIFGIFKKNSDELLGLINAFEFKEKDDENIIPFKCIENETMCETGISIFKAENFGKGYATEAYQIFLKYLKNAYNITKTIIYTHPTNERAQGFYKKLGYKNLVVCKEGDFEFIKMEFE